MKWKQFFYENKKIISIIFIILTLIFIIAAFLIYDYKITKQDKLKKQEETENYINKLPEELKQNIPNTGDIIFIQFFTNENKNKDILPLLKQEKFRKSLYYALNRKEITQNEKNLKPISVLFTKACFSDNKKYFPKTFLPQNEKIMQIYNDLDLKNYGFNEKKALQCLQESWNDLSPEDKNKNYVLRFKIDEDVKDINTSIQEKIVEQINNLFQNFLNKNKLDQNKFKIEITSETDFDMRLDIMQPIDDYNKEDYYLNFIKYVYKYKDDSKISIDLSHIKKYLEDQINKGKILENKDEPVEELLIKNPKTEEELKQKVDTDNKYKKSNFGFKNVLNTGYFKGTIDDFYEFMTDNIFKLFPSLGLGTESLKEESSELKELKQKTFEEIFEKALCLLHEEMLQISVCVYNEENQN